MVMTSGLGHRSRHIQAPTLGAGLCVQLAQTLTFELVDPFSKRSLTFSGWWSRVSMRPSDGILTSSAAPMSGSRQAYLVHYSMNLLGAVNMSRFLHPSTSNIREQTVIHR